MFGHSDGMPVALTVALRRPDLVRRLVLASGPFHHSGWMPGVIDLDEETTEFFVDYYGAVSPDGPEHFHVVAEKLRRTHLGEPTFTVEDLARYEGKTLIMMSDNDEVVIEHIHTMHRAFPHAQLCFVPGTGHGFPVDKPGLTNRIVTDFLTEEAIS